MIPCDKSEWVAAYNLGSLDADEREQFERHLPTCQSCQADLRAVVVAGAQSGIPVPGFMTALMAKDVGLVLREAERAGVPAACSR